MGDGCVRAGDTRNPEYPLRLLVPVELKLQISWLRVFVEGVEIVGSILLAFFGAAATEIGAQEPFVFEPGVRLRVTAPDCELRGQATGFRALRADTLVLYGTECPLASVTGLDVSRGQKSHVGMGILVGAGAGALVGFAMCASTDVCGILSDNDIKGDVVAISVVVGGLLGLLVGVNIKTERWEEVPLDQLRVSLAPQRDGGFALGFSVRF